MKIHLPESKSWQRTHFFLHLGLSLLQKRFLCVKLQYLISIYLYWIVCILKNKFTVKHFVALPPLYSMLSPLVWAYVLPLVTAAHEINPTGSYKLNPGVVVVVIYTSVVQSYFQELQSVPQVKSISSEFFKKEILYTF